MALVIAQKESPMSQFISVRIGATTPLSNSCAGHVFLAFSNHQKQKQLIEIVTNEVSIGDLTNIIELVRSQGYERLLSKQIQSVEEFGFPIFDVNNEVVACLVLPFLHYSGDEKTVNISLAIKSARNCAMNISLRLGA